MTSKPEGPLEVGPDHPCWAAYDDDDWNGHTFGQWVTRLKGLTVVLYPPPTCPPETIKGVKESVARFAKSVAVAGQ